MAYFKYKKYDIYYDVKGSGKPIVLLNGIMMSTLSWEPFVNSLMQNNTLIRLDFIDQGKSSKVDFNYTHEIQIEVLKALLDHLNLKQVNLVGISYGSEVALGFTIKYQDYVDRLLLFNTAAYTSSWLKEIGRSWIKAGKTNDPEAYYKTAIPIIYSQEFYEDNSEWLKQRESLLIDIFKNKDFINAMERLTLSSESYNVVNEVSKINIPTLIVSAENDYLTPKENQEELHKLIKTSHLVHIPNCSHASMYDKPLIFISLILGFINTADVSFKI